MQPVGKPTNKIFPICGPEFRDWRGTLVWHLSPSDVIQLCLVCRDAFDSFHTFFEQSMNRTPEGLRVVKTLLEKYQPGFVSPIQPETGNERVQSFYRIAQASAIREAIAPNWESNEVRMILRNCFGEKPLTTAPAKAQVDALRMLASIPRKEKVDKTSLFNDILFFHKAFETFDPELIKKAFFTLMPGNKKWNYTVHSVLAAKASWALCTTPPLEANSTEEKKQETMTKLARAQILMNCLAVARIKNMPTSVVNIDRLSSCALDEYSRFILQLRGAIEHPMAYSDVTKRVQEAPPGLYECLSKLEDSLRCNKRDELRQTMNTLMASYLPTYLPTFYCMTSRLAAVHDVPIHPERPRNETQQLFQEKLVQLYEAYPPLSLRGESSVRNTILILFQGRLKIMTNPCFHWLSFEQSETEANSPLSRAHLLPAIPEAAPEANQPDGAAHPD